MSFLKPLTPLQERRKKASERWEAAREKHSKEHSWFYRLRKSLPPPDQMNPEQLKLWMIGRARLSNAVKEYAREEQIYNSEMNPLLEFSSEVTSDITKEIVNQVIERIMGIKPSEIMLAKDTQKAQEKAKAEAEFSDSFKKIAKVAKERTVELDIDGEPIDDASMDTPNIEPKPRRSILDEMPRFDPALNLGSTLRSEPETFGDMANTPEIDSTNVSPQTLQGDSEEGV